MKTPKTPKPPPRYTPPKPRITPDQGGYFGIKQPDVAAAFGWLISYWPHVEEQMIPVFEELITGQSAQAHPDITRASREIFRTIISQRTRIDVMKALLESPHNVSKGQIFDEIIDEFKNLNSIRNDYVHGLWLWDEVKQALHFWDACAELSSNVEPRLVELTELNSVLARMKSLIEKIHLRHGPPSSP